MSIKLASLLTYKNIPLDVLQNKIVAIDISPWLYKYLFTYGTKTQSALSNADGVLTGHLLGFLYFIKNLKRANIKPIICIDGSTPDIKRQEVTKRGVQRKKSFDKYQLLEKMGLSLNRQQEKSKLQSTLYIGDFEKKMIIECCEYLGLTYYTSPYVEGQKACAMLKTLGLADECLTPDRDAIMYQVSFFSKIDFKNKIVTYYDYKENLSNFNINSHDQLLCAIICSGCDYTNGLFRIGPKKIIGLLAEPKLKDLIEKQIPNYDQIYVTLTSVIPLSGLVHSEPNPCKFVEFLQRLGFSQLSILDFSMHLF